MKSLKVLPHMCEQQRQEFDNLMYAADEIGAAATSVNSQGAHGYSLLIEARDKFRSTLQEFMQHVRICVEEEDTPVHHKF